MAIDASAIERPLPRPGRDLVGYAAARVLEALLEAVLALGFLERGYTRNAAGKAFQAWRALTAALLALERDRVAEKLGEKERKWLMEKGIPRVPSTRLRSLARLVEAAGVQYFYPLTEVALSLHDYQYHGPDPDMALSRYRGREEAARDVEYLAARIAELVEKHVRPRLEEEGRWAREHEEALARLRERLSVLL